MKHAYKPFVPATSKESVNFLQGKLLLTPKEAAHVLSISPSVIYAMMQSGRIACVRIGRSVRVPRKAVEALAGVSDE